MSLSFLLAILWEPTDPSSKEATNNCGKYLDHRNSLGRSAWHNLSTEPSFGYATQLQGQLSALLLIPDQPLHQKLLACRQRCGRRSSHADNVGPVAGCQLTRQMNGCNGVRRTSLQGRQHQFDVGGTGHRRTAASGCAGCQQWPKGRQPACRRGRQQCLG